MNIQAQQLKFGLLFIRQCGGKIKGKYMKKFLGIILSVAMLFGLSSFNIHAEESQTPTLPSVPVILDVDMATDVDDATAVRIAEELSIEGYIDLKGVAFCVNPQNGNEVRAMEGALDYMGLTTIPIGQASTNHYDYSPYYESLWKHKTTNHPVYKNAVNMYKQILAESPTKVRIVTTGFLLNISSLLKDPEGYALVRDKVDSIYVAGGEYHGMCWNLSYQSDVTAATNYVTTHTPVSIYFAMDVLGANQCGGSLTKMDKSNSDFLSDAMHIFGLVDGQNYGNCDGTAVYCCAMQDYLYNGLYKATPCTLKIEENGLLTQKATANPTMLYMLEATMVKDKWELYGSSLYTTTMDKIINADYLRKHPEVLNK